MATTFAASPVYSGLALSALFTGNADPVQAEVPYIISGPGSPGKCTAKTTPSMTITCAPFTCWLPGPSPATAGGGPWSTGDAAFDVTFDAPDLNNPRIDVLTVQWTGSGDPATSPVTPAMGQLVVMKGTAQAVPVAPVPPAGSLVVAQFAIGAGAGAVIGSANISHKAYIGSLRGGVIRVWSGAFGPLVQRCQPVYFESLNRMQIYEADGTIATFPGIGFNPDWYFSGVPGGFVIPQNGALMGFATAAQAVQMGFSNLFTGAIATLNESGSYQVRASGTITQSATGVQRRIYIERQTSAGAKIERIQNGPTISGQSNAFGPRLSVSGRLRCNAGERLVAGIYHDAGGNLSPANVDGDWVFEGYKAMDL